MKRLLALCLMLAVLCSTALADQWGMSGEMSEFFKRSGEYDDVRYPEISSGYSRDAAFVHFIVRKGNENLLVLLRRSAEGRLEEAGRYPGALGSPASGYPTDFWNSATEDGFCLKSMWSNTGEEYVFAWHGEEMVLQHANTGSMTFTLREDGAGYTVNDGWQDLRWLSRPLALAEFRMAMLPQSSAEVFLRETHLSWFEELADYSRRIRVDMDKAQTLPVYAAPSAEAWRGAEGRAAVSLSAPFEVLAACPGGWHMIEYEISRAERRIGFVQGLEVEGAQELHPAVTQETLAVNTVVTDDPHGTCREMLTLAAGTQVEVLGCLDANWLCIRTEAEGREAWGFIPLTSVMIAEKYQRRDVMEQLQGTWRTTGGGQLLGDGVIFGMDGSMTICTAEDYETFPPERLIPCEEVASWCVCDPWDSGKSWIVLWPWEGEPSVYEISLTRDEQGTDTLEATWAEAGGGYQRYDMP